MLGSRDVSWVYSRVQMFVFVASLGLLLIDSLILAITNPNEFCMKEEAQGQAHHRRMRRVYAYIGNSPYPLRGGFSHTCGKMHATARMIQGRTPR